LTKYIVFTGPESSGKTTIANEIASLFDFPLVDEYARSYLANLDRKYQNEDLSHIAMGQENLESLYHHHPRIICDTDLLTLYIWRLEVFNIIDDDWAQKLSNVYPTERLYLLCSPDIPWQYDELRENPDDRDRLFTLYKETMTSFGMNFVVLNGNHGERMAIVRKMLE
jgi:nicotinamide riboside kinase